ncbi:putative alpha-farnesene synthase [Lupinus albus]|uniref:Putative alpha-farnesene synthase n=1 Tax=Lupinus albus TaxID=3870 RepID=A0A6A4NZE7_LUPAL|nr:putative alpha-farnesene synthase [Lupinus albus]
MEYSLSSIQTRVENIKGKLFPSNFDIYMFVNPSAYDTAWLAIIPDSKYPSQPMFKNYLDWLLNNQNLEGFWGESDTFGKPTIQALPATLVSMVALKRWKTGASMIEKGMNFIHSNAEKLLNEVKESCPLWFAIVFLATLELAEEMGLEVVFPEAAIEIISYISRCRISYLNKEEAVGNLHYYPPLLSYLEALPPWYVSEEDISSNLSKDGSLFQSPSASAKAFMATGNQECLTYLQSLAQKFPNGVPQAYPMDEDHIKLCIVNHLQKLGLGENFLGEIEILLAEVYRNYNEQHSLVKGSNMIATQLHKDSLAFQLLRMHGYKISPSMFCWFLYDDKIRDQIEKDYEEFSSAILHVYRASNLGFREEYELDEARSFSRKFLEKFISAGNRDKKQIEQELNIPWFARLDHLDHRMWIEEKEANVLWKGKASYNRISHHYNYELLQLAIQNFEFKQSIFKNELDELKRSSIFVYFFKFKSMKFVLILNIYLDTYMIGICGVMIYIYRWTEEWGMSNMGFGREKTTYCYFAVAASTTFIPHDSYIRMLVAKSGIIITVADDFFDMIGSSSELEALTYAVGRWDSKGLSSHSKTIFDALDNLVSEVNGRYLLQEGTTDISSSLQDLWYETFLAWLIEAKWSKNGHTPSMDCYMKTSMTSIATHNMVLPASCFLKPIFPKEKLRPIQYEPLTELLMILSRLLNDVLSYQVIFYTIMFSFLCLYIYESVYLRVEQRKLWELLFSGITVRNTENTTH